MLLLTSFISNSFAETIEAEDLEETNKVEDLKETNEVEFKKVKRKKDAAKIEDTEPKKSLVEVDPEEALKDFGGMVKAVMGSTLTVQDRLTLLIKMQTMLQETVASTKTEASQLIEQLTAMVQGAVATPQSASNPFVAPPANPEQAAEPAAKPAIPLPSGPISSNPTIEMPQ